MEIINQCFNKILTIDGISYLVTGLSAKGSNDKPNQDSFGLGYDGKCLIVAVADGLGSSTHSDVGSRIAVETTLNILAKYSIQDVWEQIFQSWSSQIAGPLNQFDTTCKFVRIDGSKITLGNIGDGWFGMKTCEGYSELKNQNIFTNCTQTICSIKDGLSPYFAELGMRDVESIALSTDGFSEDFDFNSRQSLLLDMMAEISIDDCDIYGDLDNFINNWPIISNQDDKTIIFVGRVS